MGRQRSERQTGSLGRRNFRKIGMATAGALGAALAPAAAAGHSGTGGSAPGRYPTRHKTVKVDGLDIFYREAGPKDAPTILLLHGFPTSSQMFRNLIPALADRFHLLAPDYPGFGNSSMPRI